MASGATSDWRRVGRWAGRWRQRQFTQQHGHGEGKLAVQQLSATALACGGEAWAVQQRMFGRLVEAESVTGRMRAIGGL